MSVSLRALRGKASVARTVESPFMPQSSMLFTELSRTD